MTSRDLSVALIGKSLLAGAALMLLLVGEQSLDAGPQWQSRPQPSASLLPVRQAPEVNRIRRLPEPSEMPRQRSWVF
jgi:hypothetical protein